MDKEVRRELVVAVGNILLLKLTAEALESGRISVAQFAVVSEAMTVLLATYEEKYPLGAQEIPNGNGSVN